MKNKLTDFKTTKDRQNYLCDVIGVSLDNINKAIIDDEKESHCENNIGAVSIPLGVAGPVLLINEDKKTQHYIPLATTEGALVASVNRGCRAINESGGARIKVINQGVTRGVVFDTGNIEKSILLDKFIIENEKRIRTIAESTSKHIKYLGVLIKKLPNYVFARFSFDTDQAMGMNMATIASDKITQFIQVETGIRCLALSGNFCVDKKPAWLNFIQGRGRQIFAEVQINRTILSEVLKTKAHKFFDCWLAKCMIGSAISGSMGFNGHYANIVSAFFIATGQDPAHTVEGSLGITTTKLLDEENIYFSIQMPSVMMGVVGGGTNLKTQKEAISITQTKSVDDLAAVLGAAVLAGEMSLLASLSEGSLSATHSRLGR